MDYIFIINAEHLQRVLIEFAQYYNASHPHQGIDQQMPIPGNRTLALFKAERYSAELSKITFVHRTTASFPPFDFISVQ
jgi:hypothetical protein